MTAVLSPALAVQYLAELEPALDAVAITGSDGTTLAGDPSLPERSGRSPRCLTARSARHTVIAQVPAGALEDLVRHDLEAVARELG